MNVLCCNINYHKTFDENLKKWFSNTRSFPYHEINKFILLLRKDVYPCENINGYGKFNETSLSEKECFYSHLNIEYILLMQITRMENEFRWILWFVCSVQYIFANWCIAVLKTFETCVLKHINSNLHIFLLHLD